MKSQVDLQTSGSLPQNSQPEIYQIHTEKNREEILSVHRYDASITMIVSPEKTYKSRTYVLINGSQPEVTDHQGIRWSQAIFNPDGSLFVDLGEKIL
jgi:hypothetical protein